MNFNRQSEENGVKLYRYIAIASSLIYRLFAIQKKESPKVLKSRPQCIPERILIPRSFAIKFR